MSTTARHKLSGPSLGESAEESLYYPKPTSPTAGAGAKRLFSNRDLARHEEQGESITVQLENDDEDTPTGKRYKSSEWPLSNPQVPRDAPSNRAPLRNRNSQTPSSRRLSPNTRPSKFLEGSMNDRVSNKPPTPFLGSQEEFLSQYDVDVGGRDSALSSRIETNRHSIYRFGKSIASTFNPTNWKIWSKDKHEIEDEESAHAKSLRESKEKAERIYRELKESGRFRDAAHISQTAYQPVQSPDKRAPASKHDSGIEFGENDAYPRYSRDTSRENVSNPRHSRETSRENKRMGRVFLETPAVQHSTRGYSPAPSNLSGSVAHSDSSSPSKSSMFKRGSLSNLSGRFKKPSISNIKKSFVGESKESLAYSSSFADIDHQARRMPSRKDLQKQQKLVKRVSDLEGKLEAARRQLSDALNEPVPSFPAAHTERVGRSRFVPGALASLPSERLLSGYLDPDDDDDENDGPSLKSHVTKDAPTMSDARSAVASLGGMHPEVIIRSIEIEPEIENNQMVQDHELLRKTQLAEEATSIADPPTESSPLKDDDTKVRASIDLGHMSDTEATSRAPLPKSTPIKKRKSASSGFANDGGSYKSSQDEEDSEETEIKKETPRPLRQKTPTSLVRPSKLQKTTPNTPGKAQTSPQNVRTSAQRIKLRPNSASAQAVPRRPSIQATPTSNSQPTARKLSKTQPALEQSRQQSAESPPSSSTFLGMKYENQPSSNPKAGSRVSAPSSGRYDPHNLVYSADPNTEPDVPPMPPLPKNIRLANGEVISTATSATVIISKPQFQVGYKKLTKSRVPSPMKQDADEKKPFEWPEDVF